MANIRGAYEFLVAMGHQVEVWRDDPTLLRAYIDGLILGSISTNHFEQCVVLDMMNNDAVAPTCVVASGPEPFVVGGVEHAQFLIQLEDDDGGVIGSADVAFSMANAEKIAWSLANKLEIECVLELGKI